MRFQLVTVHAFQMGHQFGINIPRRVAPKEAIRVGIPFNNIPDIQARIVMSTEQFIGKLRAFGQPQLVVRPMDEGNRNIQPLE